MKSTMLMIAMAGGLFAAEVAAQKALVPQDLPTQTQGIDYRPMWSLDGQGRSKVDDFVVDKAKDVIALPVADGVVKYLPGQRGYIHWREAGDGAMYLATAGRLVRVADVFRARDARGRPVLIVDPVAGPPSTLPEGAFTLGPGADLDGSTGGREKQAKSRKSMHDAPPLGGIADSERDHDMSFDVAAAGQPWFARPTTDDDFWNLDTSALLLLASL